MVFPKKDIRQKTFVGSAKKVDEQVNEFSKGVESIGRTINALRIDEPFLDTETKEKFEENDVLIICTIIYQEK
jgi:hypothetical protein